VWRRRVVRLLTYLGLAVIAIVMLYPFWSMGIASFRSLEQYQLGHGFSLTSWRQLFHTLPVGHQLLSSTIVTVGAIALILAVSATAGYALGVLRYRFATVLFLLIVPVITMRLLAEERRSGTLELLLTSPVREFEIVLAKFAASVTMIALMLLLTASHAVVLGIYAEPDWGPIYSGFLGLFLLAGALSVRVIGSQFDDDINTLRLRQASLVDGRAGWRFSRRIEIFGALENALDREVDTTDRVLERRINLGRRD